MLDGVHQLPWPFWITHVRMPWSSPSNQKNPHEHKDLQMISECFLATEASLNFRALVADFANVKSFFLPQDQKLTLKSQAQKQFYISLSNPAVNIENCLSHSKRIQR
jgi:hypothetical protein